MAITAGEASKLFQVKLAGDKDFLIEGVGDPRTATAHAACFIAHQKYLAAVSQSQAKCWIIDPRFHEALDDKSKAGRTFLLSPHPYLTFIKLVNHFFPVQKAKPFLSKQSFIHESASVDPTCQVEPFVSIGAGAKVGPRVVLHPGVWIGDHATVGEESILYSGVKIYPNSIVGKRNILHSGCVIGSDGFGFVPDNGIQVKVPQVGRTITHDDVEVGANTTIDRGAFGDTVIGQGTKIDNLVQIGHNCVVGKNCILCAFVGLSGNTTLGDNVLMAGQAGTKGHLKIGDRVNIGAQSGITKDVPSDSDIKGYPPQSVKDFLRNQALYLKLPELYKRLLRLEKKVGVESEDSVE